MLSKKIFFTVMIYQVFEENEGAGGKWGKGGMFKLKNDILVKELYCCYPTI